jgi:hypothetical protein
MEEAAVDGRGKVVIDERRRRRRRSRYWQVV